MYTAFAKEISVVIGLLLNHMAAIEAGQPMAADSILSDLQMDELIEELELLQRIQLSVLRQRTRQAGKLFFHLDADVRNMMTTDAVGFCEYVLTSQA